MKVTYDLKDTRYNCYEESYLETKNKYGFFLDDNHLRLLQMTQHGFAAGGGSQPHRVARFLQPPQNLRRSKKAFLNFGMNRNKEIQMKALVFDMDGVLFDTEIVCMKAWMAVAEKNGIHALVTGESVGQVASQTLDAMVCTDAGPCPPCPRAGPPPPAPGRRGRRRRSPGPPRGR